MARARDDATKSLVRMLFIIFAAQAAVNVLLMSGFGFHWAGLVTMVVWLPLSVFVGHLHGRMERERRQ